MFKKKINLLGHTRLLTDPSQFCISIRPMPTKKGLNVLSLNPSYTNLHLSFFR